MALPTYLDLPGFRTRTLLPVSDVDYVEERNPGFVVTRINVAISYIHGRLRKRYGKTIPFASPYPEIVVDWITRLVTIDVLRKRGANPSDANFQLFVTEAQRALDELKEAADSKDGLFDLPSPEEGASDVSTGGPLGYSETSPYVWADQQARQGRAEDQNSTSGSSGPFGSGDS